MSSVDVFNVAILSTLGFNVLVFAGYLIRHCVFLRNIYFQALFLRLGYVMPLMSILIYIGFNNPTIDQYTEIVIALIEAFCIVTFFGLVISGARENVDVIDVLYSKTTPFACCTLNCKKADKPTSLNKISRNVTQFIFFKPLIAALLIAVTRLPNPKVALLVGVILRVCSTAVTVTAVFTCLSCMLILSSVKAYQKPELNMELKFIAVKSYFVLLVLDTLLIQPILNSTQTPPIACQGVGTIVFDQASCDARFKNLIMMVETTIYSVLVFYAFTPSNFVVEDKKLSSSSLLCKSLEFWDIYSKYVFASHSNKVDVDSTTQMVDFSPKKEEV